MRSGGSKGSKGSRSKSPSSRKKKYERYRHNVDETYKPCLDNEVIEKSDRPKRKRPALKKISYAETSPKKKEKQQRKPNSPTL